MLYLYSKLLLREEWTMLAVRLPAEIEQRLDALAKKTGRSKTFYVREAILEHIDDIEDYYLAVQRLEENLPTIPLEEVERRLGLAD
jgi:RHH-type rel operon transcriptional repressor/antitoxin RelB